MDPTPSSRRDSIAPWQPVDCCGSAPENITLAYIHRHEETAMTRLLYASLGLCLLLFAFSVAVEAKEEIGLPELGKPAPAFDLAATQIDKVLPDKKDAKTL